MSLLSTFEKISSGNLVKMEFRPHHGGLLDFFEDRSNYSEHRCKRGLMSAALFSFRASTKGFVWSWWWTLLVLLLLLSLSSASPVSPSSSLPMKAKWTNPCGLRPQTLRRLSSHFQQHFGVTPLSNAELLQNIVLAAKNALTHSRYFKEKYVKKTFHVSRWWEHHELWKDMRYDWLPNWRQIPKHLHEKTPKAHLDTLTVNALLPALYEYLQRIAVGLEQVALDQVVYDANFAKEFNEAEFRLKAVLCEIEIAMLERNLPLPSQQPFKKNSEQRFSEKSSGIGRWVMHPGLRDVSDASFRNLRDWYIYRDYMNGLEYVIHALDHVNQRQGGQRRRRRRRRRPRRQGQLGQRLLKQHLV